MVRYILSLCITIWYCTECKGQDTTGSAEVIPKATSAEYLISAGVGTGYYPLRAIEFNKYQRAYFRPSHFLSFRYSHTLWIELGAAYTSQTFHLRSLPLGLYTNPVTTHKEMSIIDLRHRLGYKIVSSKNINVSMYGAVNIGILIKGRKVRRGLYDEPNCNPCGEKIFVKYPQSYSIGGTIDHSLLPYLSISLRSELNYVQKGILVFNNNSRFQVVIFTGIGINLQ